MPEGGKGYIGGGPRMRQFRFSVAIILPPRKGGGGGKIIFVDMTGSLIWRVVSILFPAAFFPGWGEKTFFSLLCANIGSHAYVALWEKERKKPPSCVSAQCEEKGTKRSDGSR